MLNFVDRLTIKASNIVRQGAQSTMTELEFLENEIVKWKGSPERIMQIKGFLYYENEHDILNRKRTMIGEDGKLQVVENLPNNHVIDNQYAKMVNQKTNYLLGKPFSIECDNEAYVNQLKRIFGKKFRKLLKSCGKSAFNSAIAWVYPFYNNEGKLDFRMFPGYEILPFWKDSEHTQLDMAVRLYIVLGYEGIHPVVIEKVEIFKSDGIHRYILEGNKLIPDVDLSGTDSHVPYVVTTNEKKEQVGLNWSRIPFVAFKCNEAEIPLLKRIKSLQDGINVMLSDFTNNMQEDARNTILVLKNYDGTNLGEFRKNLATFGAVKVRYDGDTKGGVETLEITVNAENYKAIIEIFKKALVENAMGYDAKDDRLSGNPNQMNIQSMYSDIDLDANDMETEFQAALEELLFFVNAYLANAGLGNFENEEVNFIFNRDVLINESETISNCGASVGLISDETIVEQHPWVDDVQKEIARLKKQKQAETQEALEAYNPFKSKTESDDE